MKFLTEDKTHTLPYILHHNIKIHRGATAYTITTDTNYEQLHSSGVTTIVA